MKNSQVTQHVGRCHCGKVRFAVEVDVTQATSCNCTICRRTNQVGGSVKPAAFTLHQGKEALTRYPNAIGARYFCSTCGIHVYGEGDLPDMGGAFVSINFNTLEDVDTGLMAVRHWDGRHNAWHLGLRDTPWPVFQPGESTPGA